MSGGTVLSCFLYMPTHLWCTDTASKIDSAWNCHLYLVFLENRMKQSCALGISIGQKAFWIWVENTESSMFPANQAKKKRQVKCSHGPLLIDGLCKYRVTVSWEYPTQYIVFSLYSFILKQLKTNQFTRIFMYENGITDTVLCHYHKISCSFSRGLSLFRCIVYCPYRCVYIVNNDKNNKF